MVNIKNIFHNIMHIYRINVYKQIPCKRKTLKERLILNVCGIMRLWISLKCRYKYLASKVCTFILS